MKARCTPHRAFFIPISKRYAAGLATAPDAERKDNMADETNTQQIEQAGQQEQGNQNTPGEQNGAA